jgi:hypothetical protein
MRLQLSLIKQQLSPILARNERGLVIFMVGKMLMVYLCSDRVLSALHAAGKLHPAGELQGPVVASQHHTRPPMPAQTGFALLLYR